MAKGSRFKINGGNEKISISGDNIEKQSIKTKISGDISMIVCCDNNATENLEASMINIGNSYSLLMKGRISASGTGRGKMYKQTAPFSSGTEITIGKDNPDKFSIMPPYQVKYCFERIA